MFVAAKFSMCFTFAMMALISMMACLAGPRRYVKNLFLAQNLYASILLIFSICGSLWFSVIQEAWVMSLLFCILELNAVLFFFCKTSAISLSTVQWVCKAGAGWIGSMFR